MKKRWIKFNWTPASWVLNGSAYDEAEAHYTLSGEDLERRLANLRYEGDDLDGRLLFLDHKYKHKDDYSYDVGRLRLKHKDDAQAFAEAKLAIDYKYNLIDDLAHQIKLNELKNKNNPKAMALARLEIEHEHRLIDDYTHEIRLNNIRNKDDEKARADAKLDIDVKYNKLSAFEAAHHKIKHLTGLEHDLAVLDLRLEHGKIGKNEHDKKCAILKNEPWVAFIDSGFDPEQGIDGVFFELDWNLQWVDFLKLHGFVGHTDEEIVEDWFSEVCKSYGQTNGTPSSKLLPPIDSPYPMGYDPEE